MQNQFISATHFNQARTAVDFMTKNHIGRDVVGVKFGPHPSKVGVCLSDGEGRAMWYEVIVIAEMVIDCNAFNGEW
jgi:hypothetical protein